MSSSFTASSATSTGRAARTRREFHHVGCFSNGVLYRVGNLFWKLQSFCDSVQASTLASRVAESVLHLNDLALSRSTLLGIYAWNSHRARKRHQELQALAHTTKTKADVALELEELRQSSDSSLLLQLDEAWWTLRNSIDSYLSDAQVQAKSYSETAQLLSDYTSSCGISFPMLRRGYQHLVAVEEATHATLKKSWNTAVYITGLLAAKIQDGDALKRLARMNLRGEDTFSEITSNSSLVARVCAMEVPEELTAVLATQIRTGLAGQTLLQVRTAVEEVVMLAERMDFAGMPVPVQQEEAIEQSVDRITSSLKELSDVWGLRLEGAESHP